MLVHVCGGLAIVDVSDPINPVLMKTLTTGGNARGVSVRGSYAYVADWPTGLVVIELWSDPE